MSGIWTIVAGRPETSESREPWMSDFDHVVSEWRDGQPTGRTSGSTGEPAVHRFAPQAVQASAAATACHFGLEGRVSTWSALPASGTGGRMAVWRALALNWDLAVSEPAAAPVVPVCGAGRFDFAVATPMQARHLAASGQLDRFHHMLLGGAPIDPGLEAALMEAGSYARCRIHHGFGMTETLTHIATRPLGSDGYQPLDGVDLSIGAHGGLVVDAPERGVLQLHTRDAVAWVDPANSCDFRWLGRLDDVLNSGGIKVYPHRIEQDMQALLEPILAGRRWYVAGRPDPALGQRITLVIEGTRDVHIEEKALKIGHGMGAIRPRAVEFVPAFEETATSKVRRK